MDVPEQTINSACGLVFSHGFSGPRLLLIRKARPDWQAGRLNGLGGHILDGETPQGAMARKARDQAGLEDDATWMPLAVLKGDGFCVHFFSTWIEDEVFDSLSARGDEPLIRLAVADLNRCPLVGRLSVLVPLAMDHGIAKPVMMTWTYPPEGSLSLRKLDVGSNRSWLAAGLG